MAADGGRTANWEFLDHAGQPIGRSPAKAAYDPRTRPWYRLAANRKELVVTPPYVMEVTGEEGVTVAHAHGGNSGVVIGVDVVFSTLSRFLTSERVRPNAVTLVLDRAGRIIMQSPTVPSTTPAGGWDELAAFAAGLPAQQARGAAQSIRSDGRPYLATVEVVNPSSTAAACCGRAHERFDGRRRCGAAPRIAVTAIILAFGIVAALIFARRITACCVG